MSIFSKIKDAIFGKNAAPAPSDRQQVPAENGAAPAPAPAPTPVATQPVDVVKSLDDLAAAKGNPDLNYKTSIVDLMKLIGLDSSLDNRKDLATELGYTGEKDGSAEMNIWLHKEVMRQLAANGGKVPASMTD